MPNQSHDLRDEIARVRRELVAFRDICLPALVEPAGNAGYSYDLARPLDSWRGAVDVLIDGLPEFVAGEGSLPPDPAEYAEYLFQPVTASSHVVRDGRIAWRIELCVGWDWAAEDVLSLVPSRSGLAVDAMKDLRLHLPEVRRQVMALPVDGSYLWNLLCTCLVPIADLDPAFAKLALDGETWRAIVLGDRRSDEEVRERRLQIVDGYLRRVLNNALLHVMGGLACNHFEVILDLLDHPDLAGGGYMSLMPHYLFAVLFEKARFLHELVQEEWAG
jgi:hypothetical protein